jgi:hypothetical protein
VISDSGIRAAPGFVYSVFEDTGQKRQHISFLCQAAEGAPTKGSFHDLNEKTLNRVAEHSRRTMLSRFARESRMGNYSVYFGDQNKGEIHPTKAGH